MQNYVHDIPTRLYFGKGVVAAHLTGALSAYGKRVLLAYGGGSIKRTGLYDEITALLREGGFSWCELTGIEPNPRIESVAEGVRLCKENAVDVILAVGGGSVIDCCKAVAAGVYWEGDLWQMVLTIPRGSRTLPLVDILTIAATGSEFDGGGVITNLATNEKLPAFFTYPAVSLCDPELTYSVPAYQTAAGSADIMSHIFEGYFSRTDDCDLSDGIAESILRSVMANCPIALKDPANYTARANLMTAATVACSGIPEYGKVRTGWPCHQMEHDLSAWYDITHGAGLAILTPRWMRHLLKKDPSMTGRFVKFATRVMGLTGTDDTALAYAAIDALEAYFASTGLPQTLGELGITDEHFAEMAAHVNAVKHLDRADLPLSDEEIVQIFRACL